MKAKIPFIYLLYSVSLGKNVNAPARIKLSTSWNPPPTLFPKNDMQAFITLDTKRDPDSEKIKILELFFYQGSTLSNSLP